MRFLYQFSAIFTLSLVLVSCEQINSTTSSIAEDNTGLNKTKSVTPASVDNLYPINTEVSYIIPYPITETIAVQQTAFEAYQFAFEYAITKWNKQAILCGIPNTAIMELNLGYTKIGIGWFFMFKIPENTLEYYVYVDDGKVQGYTEAQPISLGERENVPMPLPELNTLIDSDEALDIFLQYFGNKYLINHKDAKFVCELYFMSSDEFPKWSIYDMNNAESPNTPLLAINAYTGEPIDL